MAIILNATASLFDKQQLVSFCRWGWFAILLHATYLILTSDKGKAVAIRCRKKFGEKVAMVVASYVIVGLIGAGLALLYWYSVNRAFSKLGWEPDFNPSKAVTVTSATGTTAPSKPEPELILECPEATLNIHLASTKSLSL